VKCPSVRGLTNKAERGRAPEKPAGPTLGGNSILSDKEVNEKKGNLRMIWGKGLGRGWGPWLQGERGK